MLFSMRNGGNHAGTCFMLSSIGLLTVIRATPRVISMPCILHLGQTLTDFSTISQVAAGWRISELNLIAFQDY